MTETTTRRFERSELQEMQMGLLWPIAKKMEIAGAVELSRSALVDKMYRAQDQYPEAVEALVEKLQEITVRRDSAIALEVKPKSSKPRARSKVGGAVAIVHTICNKMKDKPRKDVIAECIRQGVNENTAKTQYYHWTKKQKQ